MESVYLSRWRGLRAFVERSLVPSFHLYYDVCTVDDEAWEKNIPQRPEKAHVHWGRLQVGWFNVVANVRFPVKGGIRNAWSWPR